MIDILRKKLTFPDLLKAARTEGERWRLDVVLIEDTAAGIQLNQQLRLDRPTRMPRPTPIRPEKDKITRVHTVSHIVEQGRVFLPLTAPWLDELKRELIQFPSGKHDDQLDSMTQFLAYMEHKRLFPHTAETISLFHGWHTGRRNR